MKHATVVIDSAVRLQVKELDEQVLAALKNDFAYANPTLHMKRVLGIPLWGEPKYIKTWQLSTDGGEFRVPRGGLSKVRKILEAHKYQRIVSDQRHEGGICPDFPKYIGFDLRYYQEEAIAAAIAKQNCIIRAPTSSGKSILAMALAARLGLNTLVILPTVALFKQWCGDAIDSLSIKPGDLGIIHQKKRSLRPLTVAVQGTLASRGIDKEMKDFFGLIIVDEVQRAPAKTVFEVIDPFPAKYRVGVSADEGRKDKKEFLTHDLFGQKPAYEIKRKKLEDEGYILDVEIRVIPTNFRADWYGLAKPGDEEKEVDFNRLLDEMMADTARNNLVIDHALREIKVNNEQAIVLTHRRDHCLSFDRAFVANQVSTGLFIGGADYAKEFQKTREGILSGSVRVGVGTYQALGEGVNLPAVAVGFAVTPVGTNKFKFNQVRGRLGRLSGSTNKQKGKLYWIYDQHVFPHQLKQVISWNPTVVVYDKGKWVDASQYLKKQTRRGNEDKSRSAPFAFE